MRSHCSFSALAVNPVTIIWSPAVTVVTTLAVRCGLLRALIGTGTALVMTPGWDNSVICDTLGVLMAPLLSACPSEGAIAQTNSGGLAREEAGCGVRVGVAGRGERVAIDVFLGVKVD